jgi:hypothetical protein
MAYKNKNKNKAKIAELQKTGWRATNRKQKKLNDYRKTMSDVGLGQSEIEEIMKRRGMI